VIRWARQLDEGSHLAFPETFSMKPWVIGAAALVASIALAMACGGSSTKSNLEGVQYGGNRGA